MSRITIRGAPRRDPSPMVPPNAPKTMPPSCFRISHTFKNTPHPSPDCGSQQKLSVALPHGATLPLTDATVLDLCCLERHDNSTRTAAVLPHDEKLSILQCAKKHSCNGFFTREHLSMRPRLLAFGSKPHTCVRTSGVLSPC